MQLISTCLWFDGIALEAAKYYVSIFPNSEIQKVTHYGKEGFEIHKHPEGEVLTVEFSLNGSRFTALNGGPEFKFNEAVSLVINCDDQKEIDLFWEKLTVGGDPKSQQCGWLKDKFGVSWQVVPKNMADLMSDSHPARKDRVMKAMLQMKKLDITALNAAAFVD